MITDINPLLTGSFCTSGMKKLEQKYCAIESAFEAISSGLNSGAASATLAHFSRFGVVHQNWKLKGCFLKGGEEILLFKFLQISFRYYNLS